jgi:hypothetical protein
MTVVTGASDARHFTHLGESSCAFCGNFPEPPFMEWVTLTL